MVVDKPGKAVRRAIAAAAIFAATAVLLAACSPGADYPGVLDKPTPRAGDPMTPEQIKQATDALISDRDRLNAEGQANVQTSPPVSGTGGNSAGGTQTAGASPKP
jgi:hypothetical protein